MCTDEITVSLSLDRIGSPCYIFSNKGFQMYMTDLQISRNSVQYTNEPYVTGGNPILANDKVLFNDMLGTTLGIQSDKYEPIQRDAFGMVAQNVSENFFTGKPYIGELGYAFLFRNYRADQGKWQTQDPLGYPDGWNNFAYVNNQITIYIDFLGASGVLTIHSSSEGEASSFNVSGHSWISYKDDKTGKVTTYGTWGPVPITNGNTGLFIDLEKNRSASATRSTHLNDAQEANLMAKIKEYQDKGANAWTYTDPCSDFAIDAWKAGSEEDLGSWWIWDTPSDLTESIKKANGGKANGTYTPGGGSSVPE